MRFPLFCILHFVYAFLRFFIYFTWKRKSTCRLSIQVWKDILSNNGQRSSTPKNTQHTHIHLSPILIIILLNVNCHISSYHTTTTIFLLITLTYTQQHHLLRVTTARNKHTSSKQAPQITCYIDFFCKLLFPHAFHSHKDTHTLTHLLYALSP